MSEIKLSYVLTTFNKLPYLREVMRLLLENIQADEEIVVVDGASTDGTLDYLQKLYNEGLVHQFVSESDKGEAHGFNKAILLARGELIKPISDDDVFYYPSIRECRRFLEDNPSIDALVGNNATANSNSLHPPFLNVEMQQEFEKWVSLHNETFYCNCLPLMLRKKSISLLGLFNPQYICVDLEYTIRTGKIANYAFATQFIATRILNASSNGEKFAERCRQEQKQLCTIYNYPMPLTWAGTNEKKNGRSGWWKFKNYINTKRQLLMQSKPLPVVKRPVFAEDPPQIFEVYAYQLSQLEQLNKNIQPSYLTKTIS